MSRNILLVEPNYQTKFPPLGLMKISTYHKMLGDNVKFIKGYNQDILYDFWDKIYISTLFTYNWKVTIETIKWYKWLVKDDVSRIVVGGILATLMGEEIWKETGIIPHLGLLHTSRDVGDDNDLIIENMIPDYSLFNESSHKYTLIDDSYFGYSTRGCVRKCPFCGVHKLEPDFIDYKDIRPYIKSIESLYGHKQHLVLFDNNILASERLADIVNDICELGFFRDAKDEKRRQRHVDFNQGVDARFITEDRFKLLSKIAIHPLRIAFDHIKYKNIYTKSVKMASKYNIHHLSNYILYNYEDTPEDFWERLKINIELNKEYDLQIYSFPMKYIPLNAKDRTYMGKYWNWQFVRGVQRILNVMKGAVMYKEDFFYRAFGETKDEFLAILHMPEHILMNRGRDVQSAENEWLLLFNSLTKNEKNELLRVLCEGRHKNKLLNIIAKMHNKKLKSILDYYISPESITLLSGNLFVEESI